MNTNNFPSKTSVATLHLADGVAWSADAERVYICATVNGPERGIATRGLPAPLLNLIFHQLAIGTTRADLLMLLGLQHFQLARKLLAELDTLGHIERRRLVLQRTAPLDVHTFNGQDVPPQTRLDLPRRARLVIHECALHACLLPQTLMALTGAEQRIYVLHAGAAQIVLSCANTESACPVCLLLWFVGSKSLPLHYLNALLLQSTQPRRALAPVRLERALRALDLGCSAIAYYPSEGDVVEEAFPSRHPACHCERRRTRPGASTMERGIHAHSA